MNLFHLALISTGILLALGASLLAPLFLHSRGSSPPMQTVMLSFDINDETGLPEWCDELSAILRTKDIKATIFIVGKIAEQHPDCVRNLSTNEKLDIGSKTYNHASLPSIQNYTLELEEVKKGKEAVDNAGNINSLSFRAPFRSTDENIYSLLNRNGILADFSYTQQYNKYYGGYFIWFNVTSYTATDQTANLLKDLPVTETPIIIDFDNHDSIENIRNLIIELKTDEIQFVNASDLTEFELTLRKGTA